MHTYIITLSIIICFILSSCTDSRTDGIIPGTHEQTVMWDSGSLKQRFYTVSLQPDTQKQGPFEQWYESGVAEIRGLYKDGLKHGYWQYYDDNGNKSKKVLFQLGEPMRSIIAPPYDIQRETMHPHHYHPGRPRW